ncbi:hypothetical protein VTK56DRAFT_9034 [Thermocarpiscus australiensis]
MLTGVLPSLSSEMSITQALARVNSKRASTPTKVPACSYLGNATWSCPTLGVLDPGRNRNRTKSATSSLRLPANQRCSDTILWGPSARLVETSVPTAAHFAIIEAVEGKGRKLEAGGFSSSKVAPLCTSPRPATITHSRPNPPVASARLPGLPPNSVVTSSTSVGQVDVNRS